jgi:hypothetical protein
MLFSRQLRLGRKLRILLFALPNSALGYGISLENDPVNPDVIWSIVETADEKTAIAKVIESGRCVVAIFNELVTNVATAEMSLKPGMESMRALLSKCTPCPASALPDTGIVNSAIERVVLGIASTDVGALSAPCDVSSWQIMTNTYIANNKSRVEVRLDQEDEGAQQEAVAAWLVDAIQPSGVVSNPEIQEGKSWRELCDLLLSYDNGVFLFESKALCVGKGDLRSRDRLSRTLGKRIDTAARQLSGAVSNLRRGFPVRDASGKPFTVETAKPPHKIIIVPEFSLLQPDDFGPAFMKKYWLPNQGFLHILDMIELYRVVQASMMISRAGKMTTPIMALDYYLMDRAEKVVQSKTLLIEVMLRIQ